MPKPVSAAQLLTSGVTLENTLLKSPSSCILQVPNPCRKYLHAHSSLLLIIQVGVCVALHPLDAAGHNRTFHLYRWCATLPTLFN